MMRNGTWTILVAVAALAGCTTADQQTTKSVQKTESPSLIQEALDKCVSNVNSWENSEKREVATLMQLSLDAMPPVFCDRIMKGIVSGRIKKADMVELRRGGSTNIYKILKGG